MTVQSENNIVRTEGDGSVVAFDYNFPLVSENHLEVYLDGVLQGSGYTVTGVGDPNGGTVTFSVAPGDNVQVILRRFVPYTQLVDYITGDKFPADTHEAGLDLAMMAASQLQEQFERTIRFPITTSETSSVLPDPDDNDNWGKAYVLDSAGAGITMHPITGGGDIDVLTTLGDMVYYAGSSPTRLPRGGLFYRMVIDANTLTPSWKIPDVIRVADYFSPDGINDDYTNLQDLFDAYQLGNPTVFVFEQGKTYNLSRSLTVFGDVILDGNGATLQALSGGFTGTAAANSSSLIRNYYHGYNNVPSVISDYQDQNITIRNFHMSFNGEAAAGQGNICIWLRYVDRYYIHNCTFDDCGDATGILACRDGLTHKCTATGFINAAFDHWDGCRECGVVSCVVRSTLTDTAQGIQFTGTGSFLENRGTHACYAAYNKIYGVRHSSSHTASALIFNANDAGSSVHNCISFGNFIEDSDLGIVFSGGGSLNQSVNDIVKDVDRAPLFIQHADGNSPDQVRFINTTLLDCDNITGNALVTLSGEGAEVRGLNIINTGSPVYNYIVWAASTCSNAYVDLSSVRESVTGDTGNGRLLNSTSPASVYLTEITRPWTPIITIATPGDLAAVYTAQVGEYKVVNGMVKAHFKIQTSTFTHTTASGALRITGLPFAASTLTNAPWSNNIIFSGLTLTGMGSVAAGVGSGLSYIVLSGSGTGIANTALTHAHATTGSDVLLQGFVEYMMAPIG